MAAPVSRANILLVDDQPANLLALEAVLRDLGENLVPAPSGADALRWLKDHACAVVLLDVQMPDLDGFQTAAHIRGQEVTRDTPIIFLTAFDDDRFPVEQAYSLGAVDFLRKPFLPAALRAKVARFVELFEKAEQIRRQAELLRHLQRQELEGRLARENARLVQAEERFRLFRENVKDYAVFMLDPDGRVVDWNLGAEQVLGYGDEILGQPFATFFPPEDRQNEVPQRELRKAAETGRASDDRWHVRKDGKTFWASGITTAMRDEHGTLKGFTKVLRDSTERKRYEQALRERNAALEEADRRKDEFLAVLAHELRNPLAPVFNALAILAHDPPSAEARSAARLVIDRQVRQLARLVDELLDVSRITRGKIQLQKQPVELGVIVERAVQVCRPLVEGRHQVVTVHTGDGAWQAAQEQRPDVILMDIGLPGLNGYEVAERIRATPALAHLWLVAITGYGQNQDRQRSQRAGFDFHLVKPVDPQLLHELLATLAHGRAP